MHVYLMIKYALEEWLGVWFGSDYKSGKFERMKSQYLHMVGEYNVVDNFHQLNKKNYISKFNNISL